MLCPGCLQNEHFFVALNALPLTGNSRPLTGNFGLVVFAPCCDELFLLVLGLNPPGRDQNLSNCDRFLFLRTSVRRGLNYTPVQEQTDANLHLPLQKIPLKVVFVGLLLPID